MGNNGNADYNTKAWVWSTSAQQYWTFPNTPNVYALYAMSGDGSTVGGAYYPGYVFIGRSDGSVVLPKMTIGVFSADGNTMYGGQGDVAVWTTGAPVREIYYHPGYYEFAIACSADGGTVFGQTVNGVAWRWSEATGLKGMGHVQPFNCTPDAATVAGTDIDSTKSTTIYRWTAAATTTLTLPGSTFTSGDIPISITADGSTIWGNYKDSAGAVHAYLWTSGGLTDLGPDTVFTIQQSEHGSYRFPGSYKDANGTVHNGFYQTGGVGWVDAHDLAAAGSRNVAGWTNMQVTSVSDDGSGMCGIGNSPNGSQAFYIQAPATTIPGLAVSTAVATVAGGSTANGLASIVGIAQQNSTINLAVDSSAATLPPSVTVTTGNTSSPFAVNTVPVDTDTLVTITATMGSLTTTSQLTILAARVASVSQSPSSVTGGASSAGTVTLGSAAGPSGVVVQLSSSSASANVPNSVTVGAGHTTAPFATTTTGVNQSTSATITAKANGSTRATTLSIVPTLSGIAVSPTSVFAGQSSTGTITLVNPAKAGGVTAQLSSSSASATVPSSIQIASGQSTKTFTVSTPGNASAATVTITATSNGSTRAANLVVNVATLMVLYISQPTLLAGDSTGGVGALNGPSPIAGTMSLSSTNAHLIVPSSVPVQVGASSSDIFSVTTSFVPYTQKATVTATFNGVSKARVVTLQFAAFQVSAASPVVSGHNTLGTITLESPAGSGGVSVALSDVGAASIDVPSSALVAAGQSSVTFPITVYGVNATGRQNVLATVGGVTRKCFVTITPAPLLKVQLVAASVHAGQSTTGRAYLDGMNGSHPQAVTLSSNNPNVTVPASVTIPHDGRLSFAFTVTANSQATGTATISATLNGVTKTTLLTVN